MQPLLTPRAAAEEDDRMVETEHSGADVTTGPVEVDSDCVPLVEGNLEGGCRG